ncbi:MAG TPA: diguanylate cyclase [Acidiferrobacteraceae bacterium]|nr:diguanylate cyclase [Acidiferrobacteraceae bacterium]
MNSPKLNKVLIVEDSESVAYALAHNVERVLHLEPIVADTFATAQTALAKVWSETLIAVLDLSLPDAPDGEVVDYVLETDIPVVVLTGTLNESMRDRLLAKNIVDYVIKQSPSEVNYVIQLIHRMQLNPKIKILVVDDSKTIRASVRKMLETHRYQVFEARDGKEALAVLEENSDIVLVLTDYNMPNMDGIQLISRIREKYARSELSIIGLSSANSDSISINFLKMGANDFLNRPYPREEFYLRITQNIEYIEYVRKVEDQANKDSLTGLYNRKYLIEMGGKLFNNARRGIIKLTTIMVDIDFFKHVNDTYGHLAGDIAIKHVAAIIKRSFRSGDVVARYGGEEFCIICVNIDEQDAKNLCERIREEIDSSSFNYGGNPISVTVSIGLSTKIFDQFSGMLGSADQALYRAKRNGRNQIKAA